MRNRLLILCLLISLSTPTALQAHRGDGALCCISCAIFTSLFCCFASIHSPETHTLKERSLIAMGLATTYMVATTGLNAAAAAYNNEAQKDIPADGDQAKKEFISSTALHGAAAAFLALSIPVAWMEPRGAFLATFLTFTGMAMAAGGMSVDLVAYGRTDTHTNNQDYARALSITGFTTSFVSMFVHPFILWYRTQKIDSTPA